LRVVRARGIIKGCESFIKALPGAAGSRLRITDEAARESNFNVLELFGGIEACERAPAVNDKASP
jgi:hypothetical protein